MFISFGIVIILIIVHLVLGIDMIWDWVLCWEADIVSATATVVIAATSVLAALLGFVTYFREAEKNRIEKADKDKHNRLSVRPSLIFRFADDLVNSEDSEDIIRKSTILIVNNGIGAAFIKKIIREIDGKKFTEGNFQKCREALAKIVENFDTTTCNGISSATIMKPGEEVVLIDFEYTSKEKQIEILKKIKVSLEYESAYEEKLKPIFFKYDSKTMGG